MTHMHAGIQRFKPKYLHVFCSRLQIKNPYVYKPTAAPFVELLSSTLLNWVLNLGWWKATCSAFSRQRCVPLASRLQEMAAAKTFAFVNCLPIGGTKFHFCQISYFSHYPQCLNCAHEYSFSTIARCSKFGRGPFVRFVTKNTPFVLALLALWSRISIKQGHYAETEPVG